MPASHSKSQCSCSKRSISVLGTTTVKPVAVKKQKTQKRALVLFKGTGSVGIVLKQMGYKVVSVDWDAKFNPSICANIMTLNYKRWKQGHFDIVWASPDCTQFSKAKTQGVRDLVGACALVKQTMDIIDHLAPRLWYMENPATGLLPKQDVVKGLPFHVADYCQYYDKRLDKRMPYKKPTAFWSNASPRLWRCQGAGRCPMMDGKKHRASCGNGYYQESNTKKERYMIPTELLHDLLHTDPLQMGHKTPSQLMGSV